MAYRRPFYSLETKPAYETPQVNGYLWANATSIYPLSRKFGAAAKDYKGVNDLVFGATTASPNWFSTVGGRSLHGDGGDTANATLATSISAYPFWIAGSFSAGSLPGTAQTAFGLSGTGDALTSYLRVDVNSSSNLEFDVRTQNGSGGVTIAGPAAVIGKVYNFAFIARSITSRAAYLNGQRFTSATSDSATVSGLTKFGLLNLARTTPVQKFTGDIYWAAYGSIDPGDPFFQALSINPWPYLFTPAFKRRLVQPNTATVTARSFGYVMG